MSTRIQILINARDKASRQIRKISKNLKRLAKTTKKVGRGMAKAFKKTVGSVLNLKTAVIALAGVAGFIGLTKSILKTGGAFEDYRATLKTVLGSQEKANDAFAWLNKFAQTTPFEIDNLTASFVKLAAYGIDGTKVMRTLGDAAAAMGKDINQAVEALADAQTGEFERLKEFGIKAVQISRSNAKKMGATMADVGMTALSFTDKMGKESFKIIDRNNRAMITSTLSAIWNEKYAGAMAERSKTMNGMLSNLSDGWTNFKALVADKLLPIVKDGLQGVLDKINEWGNNGVLFGWGNMLSQVMGGAIEWVKGLGSSFTKSFEKMGWSFFSFKVDMDEMKAKGKAFGQTLIKWFNKIRDFLKTDGASMWEGIKQGANSFLTVIGAIASAIRVVTATINMAIRGYKSLWALASGKGINNAANIARGKPSGTRASGGGMGANKSYLVGERGPEIVTPSSASKVTPNAGGGSSVTNIYTSATAHGINNALGSRSDNISRGSRVGMRLTRSGGFGGYGDLSMARAR